MVRHFSVSFTLLLISLDTISMLGAIAAAETFRKIIPLGKEFPAIVWDTPLFLYFALPPIWFSILYSNKAYAPYQTYRAILEVVTVIRCGVVAAMVVPSVIYFFYRDFSRLQLIYLLGFAIAGTILLRMVIRAYFRVRGGRRYDSLKLLVVGTGSLGKHIGRQIRAYAWTGLFLAGYLIGNDDEDAEDPPDDAPVLGTIADIEEVVEDATIDEVILAYQEPEYEELRNVVYRLHQRQIILRFAPDLQDLTYLFSTVEEFEGVPIIGLREPVLTPLQRIYKRGFDLAVGSLTLMLMIPVMAAIAVMIKIDSSGPVIFGQARVGEGMRTFKMYKFRSMTSDAEQRQAEVNFYNDAGKLVHKSQHDPRVTRIGNFLRRTSLDELPQLFNVIKGDMSLVGPRPEMPWMLEEYEDWQKKRFEVPQGITGWWQVNGRSGRMMHWNTEDDLYYIRNYSIWLDLVILLRTIPAVLSQQGAY